MENGSRCTRSSGASRADHAEISYNQRKVNNVFQCNACIMHRLLLRKQCACGHPPTPPSTLLPHPDPHPHPLHTHTPFNDTIKYQIKPTLRKIFNHRKTFFVCSFHFRDKKPTDEKNAPEYLSFMCPTSLG